MYHSFISLCLQVRYVSLHFQQYVFFYILHISWRSSLNQMLQEAAPYISALGPVFNFQKICNQSEGFLQGERATCLSIILCEHSTVKILLAAFIHSIQTCYNQLSRQRLQLCELVFARLLMLLHVVTNLACQTAECSFRTSVSIAPEFWFISSHAFAGYTLQRIVALVLITAKQQFSCAHSNGIKLLNHF